jgi:hypothetical protein
MNTYVIKAIVIDSTGKTCETLLALECDNEATAVFGSFAEFSERGFDVIAIVDIHLANAFELYLIEEGNNGEI